MDRPGASEDVWHTLVHVCQQWRFVVFGSPRRLNLQLLCTPKRVQKILDIWPALPILMEFLATGMQLGNMANIAAALKQHWRARKIHIWDIPNSLMKEFAEMKKPCPELTSLKLNTNEEYVPILPDSFLGGSAPRLHTLDLCGIPFPAIRRLVLSIQNLVVLRLWSVPHSGHIPLEAMVTCMPALTALESFEVGFQSPQFQVGGGTRCLPPLMRIVLADLTKFRFKGNCEYLEGIVSLIDAPLLYHFEITFFNQLIYNTPLLHHFISRTEIIQAHYRAEVEFYNYRTEARFSSQNVMASHEVMTSHEGLFLRILCTPSDWQLSSLAQVCSSSFPLLYTLEHLKILSNPSHWQDGIENTHWMELLHPFTSVKNLVLYDGPFVAPVLQELAGAGGVTEVLPMLRNLHIEGPQQSKPVEEAIRQFTAARQLSGHPVAVLYHPWFSMTSATT